MKNRNRSSVTGAAIVASGLAIAMGGTPRTAWALEPEVVDATADAPAPLAPLAPPRHAAPAPASPPSGEAWVGPTADALLPTGIASAGVALPFLLLGAAADPDGRGLLLGVGAGSLAAAVPMIAVGATSVHYERRSDGALVAGSILVSLGASLSGGAIGTVIGNEIRYAGLDRIEQDGGYSSIDRGYLGHAIFAGLGATMALAGSLQMVFGAIEKSEDRKAEEREESEEERRLEARARDRGDAPRVPRSIPRRTAGQILVGLGAASTVAALISGFAVDDSGDFSGFHHVLTTIPFSVNAGICTAIGVPLWVTGAAEVPNTTVPEEAHDDTAWAPEIAIGAGRASMTVRF